MRSPAVRFETTRERRECEGEGCGYVRTVKILRSIAADGTVVDESWTRRCQACVWEAQAYSLLRTAHNRRERATALRRKRARRGL